MEKATRIIIIFMLFLLYCKTVVAQKVEKVYDHILDIEAPEDIRFAPEIQFLDTFANIKMVKQITVNYRSITQYVVVDTIRSFRRPMEYYKEGYSTVEIDDSTYAYLSQKLVEDWQVEGEVQNLIYTDLLKVYQSISGYRSLTFDFISKVDFINNDTMSSFKYQELTWDVIRNLPLRPLVADKIRRQVGDSTREYKREIRFPMTFQEIYEYVKATYTDSVLNKGTLYKKYSFGFDSLRQHNLDPIELLSDIILVNFLTPYYKTGIKNELIRKSILSQINFKLNEKINTLKELTGYDILSEPSINNIIYLKSFYIKHRSLKTPENPYGILWAQFYQLQLPAIETLIKNFCYETGKYYKTKKQ